MLRLSLLVFLCLASVDASLVPPESFPSASSQSTETFVFFSPPCSFVHHQISAGLELLRRGHRVVFTTLTGFSKALDSQSSGLDTSELLVLEFGPAFQWGNETFLLELVTTGNVAVNPEEERTTVHLFMDIYEAAFQKVVDGLMSDRSDPHFLKIKEFVFSKSALIIIPGPWATPIKFCQAYNLPYVVTLPSSTFASAISSPVYVPMPGLNTRGVGLSLKERILSIRAAVQREHIFSRTVDLKPYRSKPVLTLMLSIPPMTHLRYYPPLLVFTGPIVPQHRTQSHNLSPALQAFLQSNRKVIYLSLGSYSRLAVAQMDWLLDAFAPAAGEDWALVWALSADQQKRLSDSARSRISKMKHRIIVEAWTTTPAVLCHPSTVLFANHCGANGVGESLVCGKPMLCTPLFGDTPAICDAVRDNLGTTQCFSIYKDDAVVVREAAVDMMHDGNHSWERNAKRAQMLTTHAYKGVETFADWVTLAAQDQGDLSVLATPVETEGFIIAYCLDLLFFAFVGVGFLGFVCGWGWTRASNKLKLD